MPQEDLEFVNRQYELELICNPLAPQFIIIDAPAGYGKSYLLQKIALDYQQSPEFQSWKICSVDLKNNQSMSSDQFFQSWTAIANAIVDGFKGSLPITISQDIPKDQADHILASQLVPFVAKQGADVLLMFDGIEILQSNTSNWLVNLVLTLQKSLENGNRQLRVIFAGRNTRGWEQKFPMIRKRSLSPFDYKVVKEMVGMVVAREQIQARKVYLDQLSWYVLRLSGGHPRGIRNILDTTVNLGLIFPDLEYTFREQKFIKNGRGVSLFEYSVEENIYVILKNVDPILVILLEALSAIRRFDLNLLIKLIDQKALISRNEPIDWVGLNQGDLSSSLDEKQKADIIWRLLKQLLGANLISPPSAAIPMFSDEILRRLLAKKMELQTPKIYINLNEIAKGIFRDWVRTQETPGLRRVATLEILYHTLQLTPAGTSPADMKSILENELKESLATFTSWTEVQQLRSLFDDDDELKELIEQRAGATAPANLLDVIDNFLT